MSKIDWSKAPEWADRVVRSPRQRQLFWASEIERKSFKSGRQGVNNLHVRDNWEVVERRPAHFPTWPPKTFMCRCAAAPVSRTIEQRIASLRALEKRVEETRAELTRDLEALGLTWMVRDEPTAVEPKRRPGKFNNAKLGFPKSFIPGQSEEICDSCGERFGYHVGISCRP